MLSEQSLDLIFISLDDLISLPLELLFDLLELLMVVGPHIKELLTHGLDQVVNIIILLFQRLDVFVVLLLELVHELLDEVILLADDLLTGLLLHLDVLGKLLAVFLLFELLPSPVYLDVLLMRCDDLSLDLVGTLLSLFLLLNTPVVLHGVGM